MAYTVEVKVFEGGKEVKTITVPVNDQANAFHAFYDAASSVQNRRNGISVLPRRHPSLRT